MTSSDQIADCSALTLVLEREACTLNLGSLVHLRSHYFFFFLNATFCTLAT